MIEQLRSNIRVNLKYFLRNSVLHICALLVLVLFGLVGSLTMFFMSKNQSFMVLTQIFTQLNTCIYIFTGAMTLFYMQTHLSNRSLKMILTKPCKPHTWLAAAVGVPMGLALALYLLVLVTTAIASAVWKIPFQSGFVFMTLYAIAKTVILISYIALLSTLMHGVLAVASIFFFSEGMFYMLFMWSTLMGQQIPGLYAKIVDAIILGIFYVVPSLSPMSKSLAALAYSMRFSSGDWMNLSVIWAYALFVSLFFFVLSLMRLERRSLT